MPFRKLRIRKELEIVSLIDVVFLLIIFGLIVSVAGGITDVGPPLSKTFSIVIRRAPSMDDRPGLTASKRLMVEFLDAEGNPVGDTANFPIDDSLSWTFLNSSQFDELKPCQLIREQIEDFARSVRGAESEGEGEKAVIHVQVTRDTKTRIVNYITRQCVEFQTNIGWVRLVTK